jgi:hypothetical protein
MDAKLDLATTSQLNYLDKLESQRIQYAINSPYNTNHDPQTFRRQKEMTDQTGGTSSRAALNIQKRVFSPQPLENREITREVHEVVREV